MNDAPDTVRGHDGHDRLLTTMAEFTEKLRVACDTQRVARISTFILSLMTLVTCAAGAGFWMISTGYTPVRPSPIYELLGLLAALSGSIFGYLLFGHWITLEPNRDRIRSLYFALSKLNTRAAQLEDHGSDLDFDGRLELTVRLAEADTVLSRALKLVPSLRTIDDTTVK